MTGELALPFPAATLYQQSTVAGSLAERTAGAVELGQRTLDALESIYQDTPHARKYQRALHAGR